MTVLLFLEIFIISFLLNLLWEVSHSPLYETCLKAGLKKYVPLIIKTSLKDGLLVLVIYLATVLIFNNHSILNNSLQLIVFIAVSLLICYINEKISLKLKRWEYTANMPKIFGVGISPLIQIAVTGILTFVLVFMV